MGVPDEELFALIEKAKQKDPERVEALECRGFTAVAEFTAIGKKRAATSNEAKQARLSMLMGRKEIEFDEAMNAIAVIAGKPFGVAPKPWQNRTGTERFFSSGSTLSLCLDTVFSLTDGIDL